MTALSFARDWRAYVAPWPPPVEVRNDYERGVIVGVNAERRATVDYLLAMAEQAAINGGDASSWLEDVADTISSAGRR